MSRRDRKGYWLILGLVYIATGLYFIAHEKERSEPELRSVSSEGTGAASTSSTHGATDVGRHSSDIASRTGDPAEEIQSMVDSKAFAVETNGLNNPPVAGLPPTEETPFLDANDEYIWVNQSDINRMPVNVGQYLDANGESPPHSQAISNKHPST